MPQRKRATRTAVPAQSARTAVRLAGHLVVHLVVPKPRNAVLQAAALGQVKMGTAKHEKSKGAIRRAEKMALNKTAVKNDL